MEAVQVKFVAVAFTGQPETEKEEVVCPVCKRLTSLRWGAWFDKYNNSFGPDGCYVHESCLSESRKKELAAS